MKSAIAREYVQDIFGSSLSIDHEDSLVDLIIWAYDQGCTEGREDLIEERDPTEEQEWRRTR